jgi:hypothetical protein
VSINQNPNIYPIDEHPSFRGVVNEVKLELREFITTRVALFRKEMKQKAGSLKFAAPMIAVGALCLLAAFVFVNVAIVAVIAAALGGAVMSWCYSALILCGFYGVIGGAMAWIGMREIRGTGLVPTHTLEVLKKDQHWMQQEAKTQV